MESIGEIPMSHKLDLAYLFRMGLIGWQADARSNYTQYAMLHNLQQTLISVNSQKYKSKKAEPFSKMFPEHAELSGLGKSKHQSLAERWMAAVPKLQGKGNAKS